MLYESSKSFNGGVLLLAAIALGPVFASSATAGQSPQWVRISDGVIDQLTVTGAKIGWPGQTGGVAVDRTTGDVYMVVCDNGLWKSTDCGKTFTRVDKGTIGGRCETGYALQVDPQGKRLACFMIYGSSAISEDAGKTWTAFKTSHWDYGAVDWEATGKCFFALEHHTEGTLGLSRDGGKTWTKTDYGLVLAVGAFDDKTLIRADKAGIHRSTDGGATWTNVSKIVPSGNVMAVFKGTGYLVSAQGVLVSKDKGASWSVLGSPIDAVLGPYIGKDESHLVVVTEKGLAETTDAGKTWQIVAPLAPEIGTGSKANKYRVGVNYAFDPINNVFYASMMGKPTWKYTRR